MALTVLESLNQNEKCVFCRHNEINELQYGKMYKFENIITHYFCMLFSSNMEQLGEDDEGILGFLPKDIKKEVVRGNKLTCSYCQHTGATIGCSVKSCKKKFHYPCGIQHGSLHLFYGQFRSYCYAHRQSQSNIPPSAIKLTEKSICVMCQDDVTAKPLPNTVWAPCCKTTWLHRLCVQRMAINAGYFFKCPNCNNKEAFRKAMLECGIYIPDQDAAWELEPNAYYELTERYNKCDAPNCVCPNGRNFSEPGQDYEVILCSFCGSQGIHNKCGEDYFDSKGQWTCTFCSNVVSNTVPSTDTCSSAADPGPSDISRKVVNARRSQNLRKEHHSSSQPETVTQRKRNLSTDSNDGNNPRKISATESSGADASEPIHLLNSSGEPIEVVRLENLSAQSVEIGGVKVNQPSTIDNIVHLDSDDDDSVIDSVNKDIAIEKQTSARTVSEAKKRVTPNTAPSIFIDLLDDSDEEEPLQSTRANPNPTQLPVTQDQVCNSNDNDDDEDDDVIFVGCDPPESRLPKEDNSTAFIRIIDNDRVYIATPMQIRNNNLDVFGSTNVENRVTINSMNPVRTNFSVLPNERPTRNFVWQSVPLHKSNANNFPQPPLPQIISAISLESSIISNNNAGSNYISKENESNSWMTEPSEIIDLD